MPTGTGTISSSGNRVTGSGTSFLTEIKEGDYVSVISVEEHRKVISVISDTELKVDSDFSTSLSSVEFTYHRNVSFDNVVTAYYNNYWILVRKDGNLIYLNKPNGCLIDTPATQYRNDIGKFNEADVTLENIPGITLITKFGYNPDVDTAEDIWGGGGDYTGFPTATSEEFQVLSSSTDDDAGGIGALTMRFYYLNDDYEMFDSNFNYLYVDVTLDGTNPVNTGVTGMRVWRALILTSGSSGVNVGEITVRWRTTTSVVFCKLQAGVGQSELSNFTIPAGYTGYLKRYSGSMFDNSANRAILCIKQRDFGSNTYRITRRFGIATTFNVNIDVWGALTYQEKTDFVFRCASIQNANGQISVTYELILLKNT